MEKRMLEEEEMMNVPIWEKFLLSPEEASDYFGISVKKIKQIAERNPKADFILRNGWRLKIKRKKFEDFLDRTSCI